VAVLCDVETEAFIASTALPTITFPQVLLPWDRDQPGVAVRAERLGVAQVVPSAYANPEEVERAVTTVFDDPQYREAAAFQSERLAAIDSLAITCNLLEEM
jgi:UDP:flavonoid glycosyltransferase YjiC (YdhE family)